ncbi:MAG: amidohydrolase [Negativicutes bacterium]|nr:amidohydrolase [Negativicutes bacterium]
MSDTKARVEELYSILHGMPELGLKEIKTAAFLAEQLTKAGYEVQTGVGGTGVIGVMRGDAPGPVLALRADMDALHHIVNGIECAIHSCGHDAHSAMVLCVAEQAAKRKIAAGTLKILFQPAEETLQGAQGVIDAGAINDVDAIVGIHLRPGQEAKRGQATPALYHGASYIMETTIEGVTAHGARPHLGVNAIDAAAAVVNAINAIHMNPVVPTSIKVTKLHAGGAALNAIPDKAELAMDIRSQDNGLMEELLKRAERAIENAAASVGAKAVTKVKGGVPAAEYSEEIVELAREAIVAVLGKEGLLPPITTPGGEDFHFFVKRKPSIKAGYIGLGCNLSPGLHHPEMKFDTGALIDGVNILLYIVNKMVGLKS